MTTVLINTSIIWLCSLLVFELLLKKETFHRMNRIYLLFTFTAGIVLPLLPWGARVLVTTQNNTAVNGILPVPQANQVTEAATASSLPGSPVNWWWAVYLAGVAGSLVYLLYDALRLVLLYRRSARSYSGKWIIAQTGKTHTPFSFRNIIFIASREQYTEQQWQMVLQHEQQHHIQKHILDLVVLQLASILLWFHPLVYVYRHKLRLLHEYEVDQEQEQEVQAYGHFLIEQAVLRPAPALAHSFNYSPIKNRIYMLTKTKSKRSAQLRLLLLLPMLGSFIYCCAQNKASIRVDIKDNRVAKKGITLKYAGASSPNTVQIIADTIIVEDPATGQRQMKVSVTEPQPELLNNQKIIGASLLPVPPQCIQLDKAFGLEHIVKQAGIEPVLSNLPDGKYNFSISDLLIDPSGHAVYYRVLMPYKRDGGGLLLSPQQQQRIHEGIAGVLINDDLTFTIEKDKAGKAIPYGFPDDDLLLFMTIKNHQVTYSKEP